MDGVLSITQRIAGIQAQLTALSTPPPPATVDTTGTFDKLFTQAAGEFAPASATSPVDTTLAVTSAVGALDAKGVPTDLAMYGNGKIPAQALAPIGATGHSMWAPAAANFEKLLADAKADGVDIGINDSYRTYERQLELENRLGLLKDGGLAAVPGTSNHGWGRALDLHLDGEALAWMRANGEKYGFVEDTPRETWHWAYYPDRVKSA
ncbi:M15 family metallopeptidase [Georgenia satyanarayanai]|uniref:M15 family metallopeptidase n=1 Tax=Georgenia satyanarayanai TaxID=860221 RepID=UPI00204179AF|nr:M15 family metallopeptidase [Georgenia satyanarayanai]MCM3659466.1 M15 family metallopeptidase [Georgenia satyanarayanai]